MLVTNRKNVSRQSVPIAWLLRFSKELPAGDPRIYRFSARYCALSLSLLFFIQGLTAATIDLGAENSGTVNGAIVLFTDKQPTGTGVIRPFVRIQAKETEEGYNTSGRPLPFDEKDPLNYTHDLKLSDLGVTNSLGLGYYAFLLDVNDPGAAKKKMLSLDSVKIFTSATGSQTTRTVSSLGTLRFDLDAGGNNTILLDAKRNHGSGSGDMILLVPQALFAGAKASDYVYLYSKFGITAEAEAEGGFEEWATLGGIDTNPCELSVTASGGKLSCTNPVVMLNASPSDAKVTYSWTGPNGFVALTPSASATVAGTYTVTITGASGCTASANVAVTADTDLPIVTATGGTLAAGGTVQLKASSPTSGVTYEWSGPNGFSSTLQNPSVTAAGLYTVTVVSPNGCRAAMTAVVNSEVKPLTLVARGGEITCANPMTQISVTANIPGTTFRWSGPNGFTSTSASPTVNTAGSFTVTATAPGGATATATASVSADIRVPVVTATGGDITCTSNSVRLTAGSTTSGVTFAWAGPGGFTSTEQNPVVRVPGFYTVTGTAPSGCSAAAAAVVRANADVPEVTATGGTLGASGSVELHALTTSPGVTFKWTGPSGFSSTLQNPVVTQPGTYLVTVTAPNGCQADATVTVGAPMVLAATGGTISCNNNSVQLGVSGGAPGTTFIWSGPNSFTSTLQRPIVTSAGTYTVIGTSPLGVTGSAQAVVTANLDLPTVTATGGQLTCTNPTVRLTAGSVTPNLTFAWSGPAGFTSTDQNPVVAAPGTYTVRATGAGGCAATATAQVTANLDAPNVTALGGTISASGSAQITASSTTPGVTFSWAGPNGFSSTLANPTVAATGNYIVTVTAPNGCQASAIAPVIREIVPLVISATGGHLTCTNPMVELGVTGSVAGSTFTWSGPGGFSSTEMRPLVIDAGPYVVVGTTPAGASATATAVVTSFFQVPNVTAVGGKLSCTNGVVTLTATSTNPGVTFSWRGPGGFSSSLQNPVVTRAGTYMVGVTGEGGCTAFVSVDVTNASPVTVTATGAQIPCDRSAIQISAEASVANARFSWTGPNGFTSSMRNPRVALAGIYTVTATTEGGCTAVATTSVTEAPPLAVTATGGTLNCSTPFVRLTANASISGSTFSWKGPRGFRSSEQNPSVITPGVYTVTATSPTECTETALALVVDAQEPVHVNVTSSEVIDFFLAPGTNGFFDTRIVQIGRGQVVTTNLYTGWQITNDRPPTTNGVLYFSHLYNSLDTNMPAYLSKIDWNRINYVLNNKHGGTVQDVQDAIYHYTVTNPPANISATTRAIIADADSNGGCFRPIRSQPSAIILDSTDVCIAPITIIEVPGLNNPGRGKIYGGELRSNGTFQLIGQADPNLSYRLEASDDLTTWTNLGPVTNTGGVLTFGDTNAFSSPHRAYRLIGQP